MQLTTTHKATLALAYALTQNNFESVSNLLLAVKPSSHHLAHAIEFSTLPIIGLLLKSGAKIDHFAYKSIFKRKTPEPRLVFSFLAQTPPIIDPNDNLIISMACCAFAKATLPAASAVLKTSTKSQLNEILYYSCLYANDALAILALINGADPNVSFDNPSAKSQRISTLEAAFSNCDINASNNQLAKRESIICALLAHNAAPLLDLSIIDLKNTNRHNRKLAREGFLYAIGTLGLTRAAAALHCAAPLTRTILLNASNIKVSPHSPNKLSLMACFLKANNNDTPANNRKNKNRI